MNVRCPFYTNAVSIKAQWIELEGTLGTECIRKLLQEVWTTLVAWCQMRKMNFCLGKPKRLLGFVPCDYLETVRITDSVQHPIEGAIKFYHPSLECTLINAILLPPLFFFFWIVVPRSYALNLDPFLKNHKRYQHLVVLTIILKYMLSCWLCGWQLHPLYLMLTLWTEVPIKWMLLFCHWNSQIISSSFSPNGQCWN